ncbi:hypothetical protein HTZ85_10910 [Escherichia coli]|nr:hypothetical protein [Escherichia coli]
MVKDARLHVALCSNRRFWRVMPADLFLRLFFLIIIYSLLNSRRGSRHEATGEFPLPVTRHLYRRRYRGIADCAIPHFLFNKLKPVFISGMNVGIEPIIGVKG